MPSEPPQLTPEMITRAQEAVKTGSHALPLLVALLCSNAEVSSPYPLAGFFFDFLCGSRSSHSAPVSCYAQVHFDAEKREWVASGNSSGLPLVAFGSVSLVGVYRLLFAPTERPLVVAARKSGYESDAVAKSFSRTKVRLAA